MIGQPTTKFHQEESWEFDQNLCFCCKQELGGIYCPLFGRRSLKPQFRALDESYADKTYNAPRLKNRPSVFTRVTYPRGQS